VTLTGIDVSSYQSGINAVAVPSDFVIVKTTGGTGYVNPACDQEFQSARNAGKRTGIYHFAHETGYQGSAAAEAAFFLAQSAGYLDGRTLIALDYESDNQTDVAWALEWLNAVYAATGVRPLIYLNSGALRGADWSPVWNAGYGLWLAWYAVMTPTQGYNDYTGQPAANGTPPYQWGPYPAAMWQYTSTAQLPGWGGSLDASVFYGDGATWDAYCNRGSINPQSITPTGDFLMALTDAEQRALYNNLDYIASAKFKADIFAGTTDMEKAARHAFHNELLDAPITNVKTGGTTTLRTETGWTAANFSNLPANVWNAPIKNGANAAGVLANIDAKPAGTVTSAAPAPVDVQALAAQLAPLLNASQVEAFMTALRTQINK